MRCISWLWQLVDLLHKLLWLRSGQYATFLAFHSCCRCWRPYLLWPWACIYDKTQRIDCQLSCTITLSSFRLVARNNNQMIKAGMPHSLLRTNNTAYECGSLISSMPGVNLVWLTAACGAWECRTSKNSVVHMYMSTTNIVICWLFFYLSFIFFALILGFFIYLTEGEKLTG